MFLFLFKVILFIIFIFDNFFVLNEGVKRDIIYLEMKKKWMKVK